jgi:hypothetical protein
MRALHTALVLETGRTSAPVMFMKARGSLQERAKSRGASWAMFRNMALFLSAPFVGLLYAVLLPFVGLGMLAWFAAKALRESEQARQRVRAGLKVVALAMAPFAGLAYLVALPFIGLGMLAWFAVRTVTAPAA